MTATMALAVGCGAGVLTSDDAGGGDGATGSDASGGDAGGDASQGGDSGNGAQCDPQNDTCQHPLKCCPAGLANTYTCQTTDPNGQCIPKP
jgi:hypothetical protein